MNRLRDPRDDRANVCFIRVPEREEKDRETEKTFKEAMAKSFTSLVKDINL